MNKNIGKLGMLVVPLLSLGIVGGIVSASSNATAPVSQPSAIHAAVVTQSIQKDDQKDGEMSDAQEQQALQAKATISAAEARKAAEAKVGGTASSATLSDENNTLVYEVVVATQQIKVSAKDGSVLEVDVNDPEEGGQQND